MAKGLTMQGMRAGNIGQCLHSSKCKYSTLTYKVVTLRIANRYRYCFCFICLIPGSAFGHVRAIDTRWLFTFLSKFLKFVLI